VVELSEPKKMVKKTDAAIEAFKTQRVRWIMGISQTELKIEEERYRVAVDGIMKDEIERQMIIGAIKERGPLTISELSEATGISPDKILRHMIALRKTGTVSEVGEKEHQYLYTVL